MNRLAPPMSSARSDWNTPDVVLELARQMGPIALDPCSNETSIVGATVEWRLERDGDSLMRPWPATGMVWVNPPYGRSVGLWTSRCRDYAWVSGGEAIALVPARTDTTWWHRDCVPPKSDAVCFWKGRLTFLGAPASAPFPSALVYWGPRRFKFRDVFQGSGAIWV